jgi:hypothetical protein
MKSQICVPIGTDLFLGLAEFLKREGSDCDPVLAVERAIEYWIDNANWKQTELMPEIHESTSRGFTWKYKDAQLFLPHGTELRMRYKGTYHYAKVEGDDIRYNDQRLSPASLVEAITGTARNAWKDLWIKTPGNREWQRADDRRREMQEFVDDLSRYFDNTSSPDGAET